MSSPGLDAITAVAEAWASIDGKLDKFIAERDIVLGGFAKSVAVIDGHYAGYMSEAAEMIDRLNARGYDVTKIRVAELKVIK